MNRLYCHKRIVLLTDRFETLKVCNNAEERWLIYAILFLSVSPVTCISCICRRFVAPTSSVFSTSTTISSSRSCRSCGWWLWGVAIWWWVLRSVRGHEEFPVNQSKHKETNHSTSDHSLEVF